MTDFRTMWQEPGMILKLPNQLLENLTILQEKTRHTQKKIGIPSIKIETDYSQEDVGQIKTRIEAFAEV